MTMMLCKADFDELFPGLAGDRAVATGDDMLARWEDDGGQVPDRPTGVIAAANAETRPAAPVPAAAFFLLAMMNANRMMGTYRQMTGR
ncbi:hypothetical protein [Maritimibacter fusiformis]|jgi:hypothetical protein|uniref:Uncharacterized protein n=1 Tax=Maritimibacter fusiformis TaxID=2603819 RepID=A0A5D0RRV9_9RHOB|nr:hypothetical protein [Maritimibacter fusiformis]TYB83324.1 hypothetical protein FVF75_03875 [Maritimibacter fusiformis]